MSRIVAMLLDVFFTLITMVALLMLFKYSETHPYRAVVASMISGITLVYLRKIITNILSK